MAGSGFSVLGSWKELRQRRSTSAFSANREPTTVNSSEFWVLGSCQPRLSSAFSKNQEPTTKNQKGFTLIELLVAMALVALLMMMVYEGLRSGQKAAETGQAFIDRTNRVRITHEFLRAQIGRLMPLPYKQDTTNGKLFIFEGEEERIRFVGPMPGYLGFGGTYVQELELIRDGGAKSLVYRYWLHNGFDEKNIDDGDPPVLLLEGIRDASFRFKGINPEGKVGDWTSSWEDTQLTPLVVELKMEMTPESRMEWPLLEVVMMVDGGSTRGFNAGFFPSG